MKHTLIILLSIFFIVNQSIAQPVPTIEENIPFLVTFGKYSEPSWGDDDNCQIFFFVVPEDLNEPIYLRVFDPEIGNNHDEIKGDADTRTRFSIYAGTGTITDPDAKNIDPTGNFKSGTLLATKTFDATSTPQYDNEWYTFGPFNPKEGELVPMYGGRIFKIIVEGIAGDDGNLYRFYMSLDPTINKSIEGGNAFTYEYSFRLADNQNHISHIYPFVDDQTISIKLSNFDWDGDGFIRVVSVAKQGQLCAISGDNNWVTYETDISEAEHNTSLDVQFLKNRAIQIKSNNVVMSIRNQYGDLLPFYAIPIGGIPKYNYNIKVVKED